jgi:glutaredoxin
MEHTVSDSPATPADSDRVPGPNLLVYCRSWCPDCRRAKAWLDDQGIPYTEVDVDEDPDARETAAALNEGRLHTPTFVLGDGYCVDFQPDRVRELLDLP